MVKLDEQIKQIVILDKPKLNDTTYDDIFIIIYKKGLVPGKKKHKVLIGRKQPGIIKAKEGKDLFKNSYHVIKDIRDDDGGEILLPVEYNTTNKKLKAKVTTIQDTSSFFLPRSQQTTAFGRRRRSRRRSNNRRRKSKPKRRSRRRSKRRSRRKSKPKRRSRRRSKR